MTQITVVGQEKMWSKVEGLVAIAEALVIETDEQYQMGANFVTSLAPLEKEVTGTFAEPKHQSDQAHKFIVSIERKHMGPIQEAKQIANGKLEDFHTRRENERREAERKAREQREREERERAKREEEAGAEKKRKEEEALKLAEEAEAAGKPEEAEKIVEEAASVPEPEPEPIPEPAPAPIIPPKAQAEGIRTRMDWYAEVTDLTALIRAVLQGQVSQSVIEPNMKALNSMAKSHKESLRVPGVQAKSRPVVVRNRG